jgi:DNA-binding NarL/FixJ family response regulator
MATTFGPVDDECWRPREATPSIIYVDDQALSRDCFGAQLAYALPEFGVVVLPTPAAAAGKKAWLVRDARCFIYNAHSLSIEDEQLLRDLGLLQHAFDGARVVVVTDLETPENIIGAMRHGVAGYIPMSLSLKVASEAIRLVLAGGIFVPASALSSATGGEPGWAKGPGNGAARLTPRQIEVVRHLWLGEQNKRIAHELRMAEGTVKVHVKHIMKKLHAHNRTQIVLMTRQMFSNGRVAGSSQDVVSPLEDQTVRAPWSASSSTATPSRSAPSAAQGGRSQKLLQVRSAGSRPP